MIIDSIQIDDFKSFCGRHHITFSGGFTAICGQNGAGKSNLLDAILFGLGEDIKAFRVSSGAELHPMQQSEAKNRTACATVVLKGRKSVFKIKMKMHNTTRSCTLNGRSISLLKLRAVLRGEGLAFNPPSFVIYQTSVQRLLTEKNDAIESLVGEVSGVRAFKEYQKRALTELLKIQTSQAQIQDNIFQLEQRLQRDSQLLLDQKESRSVQRQLEDLKERIDDTELLLTRLHIQQQQHEGQRLGVRKQQLKKRLGSETAAHSKASEIVSESKKRLSVLMQKKADLQEQVDTVVKEHESVGVQLKMNQDLLETLRGEKLEREKELEKAVKKKGSVEKAMFDMAVQVNRQEGKAVGALAAVRDAERRLELLQSVKDASQHLHATKQQLAEAVEEQGRLKCKLSSMEERQQELNALAAASEEKCHRWKAAVEEANNAAKALISQPNRSLSESVFGLQEEYSAALEGQDTARVDFGELQRDIQFFEDKHRHLMEALERQSMQLPPMDDGYCGVLLQLVQFRPNCEGRALGTILGQSLRKHIVFSLKDADRLLQWLESKENEGEGFSVSILPVDAMVDRPAMTRQLMQSKLQRAHLDSALAGIEFPLEMLQPRPNLPSRTRAAVEKILRITCAGWLVTSNEVLAGEIVQSIAGIRCVTPSGSIHSKGKVIIPHPRRKASLTKQLIEISALEAQRADAERKVQPARAALEQSKLRVATIGKALNTQEHSLKSINAIVQQQEKEISLQDKLQREIAQVTMRIEVLQDSLEANGQHQRQLQSDIDALETSHAPSSAAMLQGASQELKRLQAKQKAASAELSKILKEQETLQRQSNSFGEHMQDLSAATTAVSFVEAERMRDDLEETAENQEMLLVQLKMALQGAIDGATVAAKKLCLRERTLESASLAVSNVSRELDQVSRVRASLVESLAKHSAEELKALEQMQFDGKTAKELSAQLLELKSALKTKQSQRRASKKRSEKKTKKKRGKKRRRLEDDQEEDEQELPAAVNEEDHARKMGELATIKQQMDTMTIGVELLKEELEGSQDKLAQATTITIDKARPLFQKLFRTLVGGLEVDLVEGKDGMRFVLSSDGEDWDGDIYKKLSGGQHTMLALSFVLALALLQPCPFYLLDEVDAALDERNQALVAKLLTKILPGSQIIAISHHAVFQRQAGNKILVERTGAMTSKITSS